MKKKIAIKIAKVKINEKEEIVCMTDLHDAMKYENLASIFTEIEKRYTHIISMIDDLYEYAKEHHIHIMNLAHMLMRDVEKLSR